jgi:hypothetical protein
MLRETRELRADGADVVLVQVEVVDAQGRRCPTALNLVDFDLTGPAEWRGGIAQGPDNFILARSLPVECGVNRVLVRSTLQAGRIVLNAKSAGLASATIELDSKAVETTDGWSRASSAAAMAGRLDRGPTPGTPSFKATRTAVTVAKASAADGGDPALAFDDNEETSWSGRKPVTFELSRVARLKEITLKTAGFRARSYPIRITVDGVEVYRGVTPRSLGGRYAIAETCGRSRRAHRAAGGQRSARCVWRNHRARRSEERHHWRAERWRGCAGDYRDRVLRTGGAVMAARQTTRFSFMTCEYQWALSLGVRFCVA